MMLRKPAESKPETTDMTDPAPVDDNAKSKKQAFVGAPNFVVGPLSELGGRFTRALFVEVPPHSVVLLRVFWGLVMMYEMNTYMKNDYYKAERYLVRPGFMFKYWAFEWIPRLDLDGWKVFFPLMSVLSGMFAVGFLYHAAAIGFFLGFSFLYLQDMGLYLNHFYLIMVLNLAYCFIPANRVASVDAWLGLVTPASSFPYWCVWLARFLVSNVYVWAGVAKMNEDWIRCEPLSHWIPRSHIFPPLQWFGMEWLQQTTEMACMMSWGGLLMDTFVAFFLAYRPTRVPAFLITMFFHYTNKMMLNIGVFPYVMVAISFIYFDPDWPLAPGRYWRWFLQRMRNQEAVLETGAPQVQMRGGSVRDAVAELSFSQKLVFALILTFSAQQTFFPLRQFAYPGNVVWTEEGHRYSWRMKLRDKTGMTVFYIKSKLNNAVYRFDPAVDEPRVLTAKQSKKVPGRPEMIILFAHYLAQQINKTEGVWPEVYTVAVATVNNRVPQYLIDPNVDLAAKTPWVWPQEHIVPLIERGEEDWTRQPWPMCKEGFPQDPNKAFSYSRDRVYRLFSRLTLQQAQRTFGQLPPTDEDKVRKCSE